MRIWWWWWCWEWWGWLWRLCGQLVNEGKNENFKSHRWQMPKQIRNGWQNFDLEFAAKRNWIQTNCTEWAMHKELIAETWLMIVTRRIACNILTCPVRSSVFHTFHTPDNIQPCMTHCLTNRNSLKRLSLHRRSLEPESPGNGGNCRI